MSAQFAAGDAGGGVLEAVLLDAPELLERAISYTRVSLGLLPRAVPDAPTPCAGCPACRVERLSLQPRAFLFHGFLSNDEADYIIKAGRVSCDISCSPASPDPGRLLLGGRQVVCLAWGLQSFDKFSALLESRAVTAALLLPTRITCAAGYPPAGRAARTAEEPGSWPRWTGDTR